jgi:RNA polymerase sigma-70 factor (ECF subfamily)
MSELRDLPESDLLVLARENDDKAFLELIARARPVCLTVARSILGNEADTEDRMQNAFLKAWRNLGRFREDASFTTWFCRIVTNECLMLIRSRRRYNEFSLDEQASPDFSVASTIPDSGADPEELVATQEIEDLLTDELRKVPK